MDAEWLQRFSGIDRLYGQGAVARLSQAAVCVVGVGGVGSWVVEALARSAVGHIRMIDADDVCVSNVNRQLPALDGNFGRSKVELLAQRVRAINPAVRVDAVEQFLTPANQESLIGDEFDVVVDACDAFRVKVELIAWCRRRKQRMVVIGSAGGRVDPTLIRVRDLSRTEHDAMLALIRKKLRSDFGFPRGEKRYFSVPAIYSLENVRYPQADGSVCGLRPSGSDGGGKLDCGGGLGAVTHVTAGFGMVAVSRCLDVLLGPENARQA
ncbi:MAG: tRNA threonylcarbamoyladenosine dehydratase [Lysobacteraceae bacterium]